MHSRLSLLAAAILVACGPAFAGTDLGEDTGMENAKGDGLEVIATVYFPSGSPQLTAKGRRALDGLAQRLAADPALAIELAGHTDDSGQESFNRRLSEQRARALGKFLVDHGVAPTRLTVIGYGMWSPLQRNDTEAGRARNRRAEVKVLP